MGKGLQHTILRAKNKTEASLLFHAHTVTALGLQAVTEDRASQEFYRVNHKKRLSKAKENRSARSTSCPLSDCHKETLECPFPWCNLEQAGVPKVPLLLSLTHELPNIPTLWNQAFQFVTVVEKTHLWLLPSGPCAGAVGSNHVTRTPPASGDRSLQE